MTNNINAEQMMSFSEAVEKDPDAAQKHKEVVGAWQFAEGEPQFVAELDFPNGSVELNAELPGFAGGWGTSPDPVQYCLYGLAACYAATFAATATAEGVTLTQLQVKAENWMDLHKQLGLSSDDIIKQIKFTVVAKGAPPETMSGLADLARERCPGVECLTRAVPLDIELES